MIILLNRTNDEIEAAMSVRELLEFCRKTIFSINIQADTTAEVMFHDDGDFGELQGAIIEIKNGKEEIVNKIVLVKPEKDKIVYRFEKRDDPRTAGKDLFYSSFKISSLNLTSTRHADMLKRCILNVMTSCRLTNGTRV